MGLLDMDLDTDPAGRRGLTGESGPPMRWGLLTPAADLTRQQPAPRGLLGDSWEDPRTMAALSMAQGLLGGRRIIDGLVNGAGAYAGSLQQSRDQAMRRALLQAQLDDVQQQAKLREAQAAKANNAMDWAARLLSGGGASSAGIGAPANLPGAAPGPVAQPSGAAPGNLQPSPQQAASIIGRLNEDQIMGAVASGALPPQALEFWKFIRTGEQMQPGYIRRSDGSVEYRGDPTKGVTLDTNGNVIAMPGAPSALGTIAGAQKEAEAAANAKFGPPITLNGRVMTPLQAAQWLGGSQAAPAPQPAPAGGPNVIPPAVQQARDTERVAILRQELARATDPDDRAAITRELQRMGQSAGQSGPGVPVQPNLIKAVEGATEGLNQDWIKNTYQGVQQAGDSATGRIEQAQIARRALAGGLGGWGTETKAGIANVLAGMGIASDAAKNYAANSQIFQKVAMDRLWTTLNEAKGPQTEGDAARAGKTFAQLGNTPKANDFILDLAQAQAERDKLRQRFYSAAIPVAKGKGDLTEVDREWQARMPSVFDMPALTKWKGFQP